MKNQKSIKLFYLILILLPVLSSAAENPTGIWVGTITDQNSPHETAEVYISIHQTEEKSVFIVLSSVEQNGNLFSSTYIGTSLINMKTYGEHGTFPITYDSENQKIIYSYPPPIFPIEYIDVHISDDGLTGSAMQHCKTCTIIYPLILRKIVGTK